MVLKPVQWEIANFTIEPWDDVVLDVEANSSPAVVFTSPPWPTCAACGKQDTTIYLGKSVRVSDTEQSFSLASYECHACGLKLHALPH